MIANRLNLSSLAGGVRSKQVGAAHVSRREMLKAAGALALGAAGLSARLKAVGEKAFGPFELRSNPGRVAFVLGENACWVIDTSQFGGAPRLDLTEEADRTRITLSGATFPGTALPANLISEVYRTLSGWRMRLHLALGSFATDLPLQDWLSGAKQARARVRLDGLATAIGTSGKLLLSGAAELRFTPDWQIHLHGPGLAQLELPDLTAAADSLIATLLPTGHPGILQHPADRRTQLSLDRRRQTWEAWPMLTRLDGGKLVAESNPFDQIRIEAVENQRGVVRHGLVAESSDADQKPLLAYEPHADIRDSAGESMRLPLRQPRLAVAFDPAGDQLALLARFAAAPVWAHGGGYSLQLGDSPNAPAFELVQRGAEVQKRCCSPAVFAIAAPMPDALVEPLQGPDLGLAELQGPTQPPTPGVEPAATQIRPTLPITLPPWNIAARAAWISVLRPADMLALEFRFVNLKLNRLGRDGLSLKREDSQRDAFVVVRFPPQAIAERAYRDPGETPEAPPVPSRASGESWLAFKIPTTISAIPYTLDGLLDWQNWEPVATPYRGDPTARATSDSPVTAIEAPYRLYLSPEEESNWSHAKTAVTHNNRTELWHTRLVKAPRTPVPPGQSRLPTVRAIWTPDYDSKLPTNGEDPLNLRPFRNTLTRRARYEIVALSSGIRPIAAAPAAPGIPIRPPIKPPIKPPIRFTPLPPPVNAEQLMLTALGAYLKLQGAWSPPKGFNVMAWRHEATTGREHFAKVVEKGYLYPFGHLAALITQTERRIENVPGTGQKAAYLRQIQYIIVAQPERVYPDPLAFGDVAARKRARKMPLRKVTVTTASTPPLDPATQSDVNGMGDEAFWPRVSGRDFQFHLVGEDWEGQRVELAAPVIFIKNSAVTGPDSAGTLNAILADYANHQDRRTSNLYGQQVAYAKKVPLPLMAPSGKPGDTIFPTSTLTFSSQHLVAGEVAMPPFYPTMEQASVQIPTLAQMTATKSPQTIQLHDIWLEKGFDPAQNQGYLFAKLPDAPSLAFGGDKTGGVITPDLPLGGLSLSHGLVGGADPTGFAGGLFDPDVFFDEAKILGGIALAKILEKINGFTANGDRKVPQITSRLLHRNDDANDVPIAIESHLTWKPAVKSFGPFLAYYNADPTKNSGTPAALDIEAEMRTPLDPPGPPTFKVDGSLTNFTVDLFNCIKLGFKELSFHTGTGKSPKTDVDLQWVVFAGPLSFVQKLREFLDNLFGDGFKIDVEPSGIRALLSVKLPDVSLGVFLLQNISVSAGLDLPFSGSQPMLVNFGFCTRENPFHLTVSALGGGGFVGITVGLHGVQMLEAALEFGGSAALDVGVASGGVSIMAGIYFKNEDGKGSTLEGYIKLNGKLEVLKIISVSLTFYMSFTFQTPNKVWGQATLTVEIEILFFSISADVHVERQFSGDGKDPSFSAMISPEQWQAYTEAFA